MTGYYLDMNDLDKATLSNRKLYKLIMGDMADDLFNKFDLWNHIKELELKEVDGAFNMQWSFYFKAC